MFLSSAGILLWMVKMDQQILQTLYTSLLFQSSQWYIWQILLSPTCAHWIKTDNCASCPRLHSNDGYKLWSQDLNLNSLAQEFVLTVNLILASPSHPSSLSLLFFSESWILNLVLYAFQPNTLPLNYIPWLPLLMNPQGFNRDPKISSSKFHSCL